MKLTDLIIDPKSLGSRLWLVDVSPAYEYRDGKRTNSVCGYRYVVALPEKGLDKINVRIDGQQQMEAPNGYVEVRFDNLEVFIYWSQGQYVVGAKATGIHVVNNKTYSGMISHPQNRLLRISAATPVVAAPLNGSNTSCPSSVSASTSRSASPTGNWQG